MWTYLRPAAAYLCGMVLATATSLDASPTPQVLFSASDLGNGLFQYELTLWNQGGSEPLSGLNVLNGNSLFGLDASSDIGAPSGWSCFAPLPPFLDDLDFFSLSPLADVPINGARSGFFFRSTLDPLVVRFSGFAVEAIGANSASQIPLPDAVFVPEPDTLLLCILGLVGLRNALARRLRGMSAGTRFLFVRRPT